MCENRAELLAALNRLVVGLDVEAIAGEHAKELVVWFSRVEHMAAAGKTLCARRVAAAGAFQESGQRSAASWLANETGDNLGTAINLLETAHQLKDLPALEDALRRGDLSPTQAAIAAAAAAEDPSKQKELLDHAKKGSVRDLRREAERICAARRSEQDAQKRYEAIKAKRSLRWWTDSDGTFRLDGRLTPDAGARLIAEIEPEAKCGFREARRQGRHEPFTAYVADALVNLVTALQNAGAPAGAGATACAAGASAAGALAGLFPACEPGAPPDPCGASGPAPSPGRAGRRTSHSVILRVDLAALRRGELEGGEVCEIPGVGPVPLAVARTVLGDAFMKLVITDGVDVQMVCHAGRHVSSFIDTALEERDPVCVVPGCDVANFLERDHWREEFAEGGPTDLPNLCRLCKRHHGLKHNKGFTLRGGPGKWEWIAPKDRAVGVDEPDDVPPWRAESE